MSSSGDEEEIGPSLDAADPEERIAFRRIRIQKRIEAQRRAELGEGADAEADANTEMSKSRKQMEESRIRLTKLHEDGDELVTNIRDATDARETAYRREEDEIKRQRRDRLAAEDKAGMERFDEITRKWDVALQKEIPQDLYEMLMQQKSSCNAMLDEKNKLINDFQMELKSRDDHYVKELKKQAESIDLMIERMDEQVSQLVTSGQTELHQIEKAFVAQRAELLESNGISWAERSAERNIRELDYLRAREKRVFEHGKQLQHMRVQDAEEYNMVKIKLETDVQILQQQLQLMKATYQLNQEKLEYNFQVLRKRDEENTITKSQQKRKITRMQDVLTNLKAKLAKQEKVYKDDNNQLKDDYGRITQQFKDLQRKSRHFTVTDQKKFTDVWIMNEDHCKDLVRRLLEEDRIIHEQQLGLPWQTCDLEFMKTSGPIITEKQRRAVPARKILQEVIADEMEEVNPAEPVSRHGSATPVRGAETPGQAGDSLRPSVTPKKYPTKLVKVILELLGDESGFLIEAKLLRLLQQLSETKGTEDETVMKEKKKDQCLMKLDAIFTALRVETEEDIYLLASYFLKQMEPPSAEKDDDKDDEDTQKEAASSILTIPHFNDQTLIHPNEVLKALRAFVDDHREAPKRPSKQMQFQLAIPDERDDRDDTSHWLKFPAVLRDRTEKVWDGLTEAMEKYSCLVTQRSALIQETEGLQSQNGELRILLHQYVNSKVNKELEIPPTRVLQLELNPPPIH